VEGADHFERRADVYAAARPPYPPELWTAVRATGLTGPGRRALDLGAGSGEATGPLLATGMDVVAVEPGPRLAARLADSYPTAEVVVARAEDLELTASTFDLVVAATSIHWLDLEIVLPQVARAITREGALLVWRNVFGDPEATVTPFRREVERIVAHRRNDSRRSAEDVEATSRALSRSGLFAVERVHTFRWSIRLDARQVGALFGTFSDWTPAEVDEVAAIVDRLGGEVVEYYSSWLIEARPTAGGPPPRAPRP
jgi:SAM-dependent methyltransferase